VPFYQDICVAHEGNNQGPNVDIFVSDPEEKLLGFKCKPIHLTDLEPTRLLLEYNVDVNALDGNSFTALDNCPKVRYRGLGTVYNIERFKS
jgi:hypothetical protein